MFMGKDVPSQVPSKYSLGGSRQPIFIIGFARSGTTWVTRLLRDYCDVGMVNEGQFIIAFGKRIKHRGDYMGATAYKKFVNRLSKDQYFDILRNNYSIEIDWKKVMATDPKFSAGVVDVLSQIASQMGKERIGSKFPGFGWHLPLLNELFTDCRILHIIRDGRDCALSHKHMVWGHQNVYSAARYWRDYLRQVGEAKAEMKGRYLEIRYEDLLEKPEQEMMRLAKFVCRDCAEHVTERFLREEKALLRRDRICLWKNAMSPRECAIFEAVAGDVLEEHGYLVTGTEYMPPAPMRMGYMAHDRLSRELWHWVRKVFRKIPERKR